MLFDEQLKKRLHGGIVVEEVLFKQVVLPEVSYLRTYWLVTHADVRSLRRVEEVYSFILSRVRANRGLFV